MKETLTPEVSLAREEVVRVQVERFHEFYSSYFNQKETIPMAMYFFETVYNLEGREELESLALNTYAKVKHMLKDTTRENVERLIDLNHITDELDIKLAKVFLENGWKSGDRIGQADYKIYYKKLGEAALRKKQLEVVLFNLKKFYELAHKPISGYIIKPAAVMSKMLGVYPLFKKVEQGYYATLPVSKGTFEAFFKVVEKQEWEFLFEAFPELKGVT
jgi:hypothetical protein